MARKVLLLTVVLLGLTASSAVATTINVTTSADVVANDGQCSLREAITAANTDAPSGSAPGECPAGTPAGNGIVLAPGNYALTSGALSVDSALSVEGQAVGATTINGEGVDRVFEVQAGASLTLSQLSVIDGRAPSGTASTGFVPGGAGGSGGAIQSAGSLTLDNVSLNANAAGMGGTGADGSAPGQAPGPGGNGGAIESTGPSLIITNSTIANNSAGAGGTAGGSSSPVGGAGGSGGGIDATGGTIVITASTINGNYAGNGGFGGFVGGVAGNGGGVSLTSPAPATFQNDTIAENAAGHSGIPLPPAGSTSDGGALLQDGGSASMTQVTIAGNSESDQFNCCTDIASGGGLTVADSALDGSCRGVTDGGHNVAVSGSGCPGLAAAFDLGQLQNNGGPTETMLPGAGSALINEVPSRGAGCLSSDQRGVSRPQGKACDAGSVEFTAPKFALSPRRVKFGHVRLGRVRRETVRIRYGSGDGPAIVGTARFSGRDARDFAIFRNRCRGTILHTSQSCTLVISFRPRRRGVRTANVTLGVSSPGTPVKIALVGTGVQ